MEIINQSLGYLYMASLAFSIPATLLIAQRFTALPDQYPAKYPGGALIIIFLFLGLLWNQNDDLYVNLGASLFNLVILSPVLFTLYCHKRIKAENFTPPGDYGILKNLSVFNSLVLAVTILLRLFA